nr:MAG TPA: hypothetical protein [Bacteriophage sp.]
MRLIMIKIYIYYIQVAAHKITPPDGSGSGYF